MLKTHFYFLMVLVGLASFLAPLHGEETLEDSALAELDPVAIPAKENEEALIQNEEIPERDKDKINAIHRDRRLFASELSTISNAVPDISDGKGNTANPVFHTQQAISQALDQCDGIAIMVGHRNILLPIMKEQGKTAPLAKRILEAVQKNAGVELFILGDDFLIKTPQTEFENPDYTIANQFVGKILNTAPSSTNPLASTPRVIILETSPEMDRSETIRQAIQDLEREVKVSREPVLKEGVPTPFLAELRMQSDIPTKVVQELIKELQAHGVTHFALKAANEGENRILITCPADVSWRKVRTLQEEFKDYNVDVRIAGSDEPVQAVTVGEPLVASDEQAEYRPVLSNPKITLPKVQVRFLGPMGMSVAVQDQTEPFQVPFRHNFVQGRIHPLKFFNIPGRTGLELFPTLELRSPLTVFGSQQDASSVNRYLEHNALAVQITDADLDQAIANNFVTKVLYLPKPDAGGAIANQSEIVSARLEPGVDPVAEAEKRGTVLAVLRIGNRTHHQPVEPTAAESPISDGPMPPVPMPEPYVEPPIKISMTNPEKADDHLKNLLASIEKQHQVTL
ncbi:MAG: hypothetical protein KDA80_20715, partial [Planctomycetaceae bacterium]|nr:hypothetical protein [Planctomycetaceae bacterium]